MLDQQPYSLFNFFYSFTAQRQALVYGNLRAVPGYWRLLQFFGMSKTPAVSFTFVAL